MLRGKCTSWWMEGFIILQCSSALRVAIISGHYDSAIMARACLCVLSRNGREKSFAYVPKIHVCYSVVHTASSSTFSHCLCLLLPSLRSAQLLMHRATWSQFETTEDTHTHTHTFSLALSLYLICFLYLSVWQRAAGDTHTLAHTHTHTHTPR